MKYMNKKYYEVSTEEKRDEIVKSRKNYETTLNTNLEIKVKNREKSFELYYLPTFTTMNLIKEIYKKDGELERLYELLPGIAKSNFLFDIVSSELQSSNEIEGVRSSKEEILNTTKKIMVNTRTNLKKMRFDSVLNSYKGLFLNKVVRPKKAEDVREIYDKIVGDEIKNDELPDGKYFRKDLAYVRGSSIEPIHTGVGKDNDSEENIISHLEKLIAFMNREEDEDISLIKIAIAHYYFGYIHPFYDGNGRTGRFISSVYLREKLSWITSLALSQGSWQNRGVYSKAFDNTNQRNMQGEINFFVDSFLRIIKDEQIYLFDKLGSKLNLLIKLEQKIKEDKNILKKEDANILFTIASEGIFNLSKEGISVDELRKQGVLSSSNETIIRKFKEFEEKGYIKIIKRRPYKAIISKDYIESISQ